MNNAAQLAGRFRRLLATIIDAILVPLLSLVLVMITGVVEDAEDYINDGYMPRVFLLAVASYLLLNGFTLWRSGQTLGKKALGIAIISSAEHDADQSRAPAQAASAPLTPAPAPLWKLICIRALFFPLLFFPLLLPVIGPWLAALPVVDQLFIFGKRRRCLHDLASGTVVVRKRA